jgi:hypothetical protein
VGCLAGIVETVGRTATTTPRKFESGGEGRTGSGTRGRLERAGKLHYGVSLNFASYQLSPRSPHVFKFLDPMMLKFPALTVPFHVFFFYLIRSWSMVKQSVDATFEDIRKHELLAEVELRVIEVQYSAPVMWITPSRRICQGFPMVISHDLRPNTASPNHQNLHLSLYVSQPLISLFPPPCISAIVLKFNVPRVTVAFA